MYRKVRLLRLSIYFQYILRNILSGKLTCISVYYSLWVAHQKFEVFSAKLFFNLVTWYANQPDSF
jgi:hypothetical protein